MGGAHLCHVDSLTETCRRGSGPMSPSAQSLILAAIAYCRCKFWTFYHHKIVLNHSILMVLMALYMVQPSLRYKPVFGMHPMHPPCTLQLLINCIMVHYTWTLRTLLHHKIALNRSFPTVLLILNLVERLESYNQIFGWTLHGPSWTLRGKRLFLTQL